MDAEKSNADKAHLIRKILGSVSIQAADAREFLELDEWLSDIGAGVLVVHASGVLEVVQSDAGG